MPSSSGRTAPTRRSAPSTSPANAISDQRSRRRDLAAGRPDAQLGPDPDRRAGRGGDAVDAHEGMDRRPGVDRGERLADLGGPFQARVGDRQLREGVGLRRSADSRCRPHRAPSRRSGRACRCARWRRRTRSRPSSPRARTRRPAGSSARPRSRRRRPPAARRGRRVPTPPSPRGRQARRAPAGRSRRRERTAAPRAGRRHGERISADRQRRPRRASASTAPDGQPAGDVEGRPSAPRSERFSTTRAASSAARRR